MVAPTNDPSRPPTPSERFAAAVDAVRRRWWVPVLAVGLAVAAGLAVHERSAKRYQATAKVLVSQGDDVRSILATSAPATIDLQREENTDLALLHLRSTAAAVRDRLHLDMSPRAVLNEISPAVDNGSNLLSISATDRDPVRAAAIANAFALQYQALRRRVARSDIQQALAAAVTRYDGMTPAERASAVGRQLAATIPRLQVAADVQTGGVAVVQRAAPPVAPAGLSLKLVAGISALLGLLVAGAAVAIMERTDDRVRDASQVEKLLGVPVLAELPAIRHGLGSGGRDEALRDAATRAAARLRPLLRRNPEPSALMVASPKVETPSSTVTAELAAALAALGERVIALGADGRASRLLEHLRAAGKVSRSAPALQAGPSQAVTEQPVAPVIVARDGVLVAGPLATDDHGPLEETKMAELIRDAKRQADVVLVDAPPLLQGADSLTLAGLADGGLLVVEKGRTSTTDARKAARLMDELGLSLAGLLVAG